VISNIIDDGLSILQYTDDKILFMDQNLEQAWNMKLLLAAFEQLVGLKTNYHKSELFYFWEAKDHELQYEQLFGCKKGSYQFRYIGFPMHFKKLYNSDWKMIEENREKIELLEGEIFICGWASSAYQFSFDDSHSVYAVFFWSTKRSVRKDRLLSFKVLLAKWVRKRCID
jgi:hypothetical protein